MTHTVKPGYNEMTWAALSVRYIVYRGFIISRYAEIGPSKKKLFQRFLETRKTPFRNTFNGDNEPENEKTHTKSPWDLESVSNEIRGLPPKSVRTSDFVLHYIEVSL